MPGQTLDALDDYRSADRLLAHGRAAEVLRAQSRLPPPAAPVSAADNLTCASANLCLGRAFAANFTPVETHAADVQQHFDTAVDHLRRIDDETSLPCGLLARAEFAIQTRNLGPAEKDLTEALAIAHRGEMRMHETDAMLGFARLSLATASERAAREQCLTVAHRCWQRATALITETGYKRRLAEASLIEAEIALARAYPNGSSQTSGNASQTGTLPSPLRRAESAPPARRGVGGGGIAASATAEAGPGRDTPSLTPPRQGEGDAFHGESGASGELDTALAALEAAADAISYQQQFSLLAKLGELAQPFPSLGPTLARLAEERAAFDKEADEQWEAHQRFVEDVRRKEAAPEADAGDVDGDAATDDIDTTGDAANELTTQVAAVLDDPDLRRKVEAMLANPEARAALAKVMAAMNARSLEDLEPEQQLGAMAAFILSRNDDEDDSDEEDADEDATEATADASDVPVSGQLGAAVEALLSDAQGREMVDGLLLHPGFRQALIAELKESKVPVPLEQLPHDIQRKFAAAFALEKGVIAVDRGDEPES